MRLARIAATACALLFVALAGTATAATQSVTIQNAAFNPPTINIAIGDTVTWTNQDLGVHSSTSTTGVWDSPDIRGQGGTFSRAFTAAGTFPYVCRFHSFMMGTIVVRAAATPAPTPVPTLPPTAPPTPVPTPIPTPRPTVAPTPVPTVAPTAEPTASPTAVPTTPAPTTAAPSETPSPVAVAAPTIQPVAPATAADGGVSTTLLVVGVGALAAVALIGLALRTIRR